MHLVNGELQYRRSESGGQTLELIQKITAIVRSYSDAALNRRTCTICRVTRLKFFAQRLFKDEMLDSDDHFSCTTWSKSQYAEGSRCAERIASMIWQEYASPSRKGIDVSDGVYPPHHQTRRLTPISAGRLQRPEGDVVCL